MADAVEVPECGGSSRRPVPADGRYELAAVGSYTIEAGGRGVGITTFRLDRGTGALEWLGEVAAVAPSFLLWHPTCPILYATHEIDSGAVSALRVGADWSLTAIGTRETGGAKPCHLAISPDVRYLFSANYDGGSVSVFRLAADGGVEVQTALVEYGAGSHVHMVDCRRDGTVSVVDLGTDRVHRYRIDATGAFVETGGYTLPTGFGPRQLIRRPTGDEVVIVGELGARILVARETTDGGLDPIADFHLAAASGAARNYPAHAELSADGRFGYVSNRGAGQIVVLDLAADPVRVAAVEPAGGTWPRHFALAGSHMYVAQQQADEIVALTRDPNTGGLTLTRRYSVASPTCIAVR